ncbi:MAG: sensor histidine kinase [Anaerolineae bacterium]|nr:sensor histidine kinase [Anaerolineae bacterium]
MREISLHILDVVENAIEAGAQHVDLQVVEDLDADRLRITVIDDGSGMDADTLQRVRDPFFTTRTTRHVGLGIPLFAAAAERCAGSLGIVSAPGGGTTVEATYQHSHIDRAPLGDLAGTLVCILMRDRAFDLRYRHARVRQGAERAFELDTVQIKQALGDMPLTHPAVRDWLRGFIAEGEAQLKEA